LAKRFSEKDEKELIKAFKSGNTIQSLSDEFSFTKVTIIRKLKKILGITLYKELNSKNNKSNEANILKEVRNINKDNLGHNSELFQNSFLDNNEIDRNKDETNFSPDSEFVEITPLNYEIENNTRKELSSIPISEIEFPNIVYMIVDKKIELEIKFLKEYPQWDFLPKNDLNRKTIEIYSDIKIAKRFCNKEQKVIKVPNTDVFKVVAPILLSRGISRIVSSEKLIAL
tara:strand:- start:679 stop:1362 length:684 start_codon:yes stop_codon:yes gene_type:complete